MKSKQFPAYPVIVAVPVYEARVLPRFGVARDFVVAEVAGGGATTLERLTWQPPKAPRLARWLAGLGVTGVICGGIHPRFIVELESEGLWVLWGQHGDVQEVIDKWARGDGAPQGGSACRDGPGAFRAAPGTSCSGTNRNRNAQGSRRDDTKGNRP